VLSPVSSSGAPRKIDGIKSIKVWVIAIEVINTRKMEMFDCKKTMERNIVATRLIWTPGSKPVKVPAKIPAISARINRGNIKKKDMVNY
jgi:hypothetical protein